MSILAPIYISVKLKVLGSTPSKDKLVTLLLI